MKIVKKLNSKSIKVLKDKGWFFVLEGSVRSAKTVTSLVKWYYFILSSNDNAFLMSGATMGSLAKNCIDGDFGIIAISDNKMIKKVDNEGNRYLSLKVGKVEKRVYYTGAEKSNNYTKIQGMSTGGWYADEITNHHKSFIEMAFSRSFAAENIFFIWTLNPENPSHWLYKEYIDKYRDENKEGYNYYHFILDDNMALDDERKDFIKASYTGMFYRRYILGERVRAEGACYPSFNRSKHIINIEPEKIIFAQIGFDIGGNKSASSLTATGFYFEGVFKLVVLDELYIKHEGNNNTKDPTWLLDKAVLFIKRIKEKYKCSDCYIDSAEQILKQGLTNRGVCNVHNSLKKPIIDRVRFTDYFFSKDRLFIMSHVVNLIEAVESAVFDDKAVEDKRLDNGTSNIDSLDSYEYSIESKMKELMY